MQRLVAFLAADAGDGVAEPLAAHDAQHVALSYALLANEYRHAVKLAPRLEYSCHGCCECLSCHCSCVGAVFCSKVVNEQRVQSFLSVPLQCAEVVPYRVKAVLLVYECDRIVHLSLGHDPVDLLQVVAQSGIVRVVPRSVVAVGPPWQASHLDGLLLEQVGSADAVLQLSVMCHDLHDVVCRGHEVALLVHLQRLQPAVIVLRVIFSALLRVFRICTLDFVTPGVFCLLCLLSGQLFLCCRVFACKVQHLLLTVRVIPEHVQPYQIERVAQLLAGGVCAVVRVCEPVIIDHQASGRASLGVGPAVVAGCRDVFIRNEFCYGLLDGVGSAERSDPSCLCQRVFLLLSQVRPDVRLS